MVPTYVRVYTQPVEFNRALGYAYDALVNGPFRFDALSAWKGLSERIAQGIYMGQGLLLPHTRIPGLPGPLMAFVVCRDGFTGIKTRNEELAQFICVLLSPAESAMAHTMEIANVAKFMLNPEWKEKALSATDEEELKKMF
ncbi:MAG: PTS sugar transporter subunit IIA [Fibrobacter sp.]|uniref:PTS sugar transporter subunit IIA n=1 Tax=Fibrobacter sp. TaxID=35828 RepID=UPI0025C4F992|nr:PTS sugar transporter subunit IIA [Fibrobacter sp.]MBQ7079678.1 PTS sugar transporter subunit IIA [Fibrobacter sp.]